MNVTVKNTAKRAIIVPGVGDIALLEGMIAPGASLEVDEALTQTDFIRHLVSIGELSVGAASTPAPVETGDIDALREQAEMLGIDVDKRWKAGRLQEEISKLTE